MLFIHGKVMLEHYKAFILQNDAVGVQRTLFQYMSLSYIEYYKLMDFDKQQVQEGLFAFHLSLVRLALPMSLQTAIPGGIWLNRLW
jgi:hypothetical protein